MRTRFWSLPVIFSLLVGCGPLTFVPIPLHSKRKSSQTPANPSPEPKTETQSEEHSKGGPFIAVTFGNSRPSSWECPTKNDTSLDPKRAVQRQTISVKMEKQRVIRKDCDGKVTSDRMEKVTFPTTDIVLTPTKWWAGSMRGTPVSVENRTTCTTPGMEWDKKLMMLLIGQGTATGVWDYVRDAAGFPRIRFSVDTSPTNSSMHVKKNQENYIDYEFGYCEEMALSPEGQKCKKMKTIEKGTLILTVNYTENLDVGGIKEIQNSDCKE